MSSNISKANCSVYDIAFHEDHIVTTVTTSGAVVEKWISQAPRVYKGRRSKLLVGLDTEWYRPDPSLPLLYRVAILQLWFGRKCLIFQLLHADYSPRCLFDFLNDDKHSFCGKGVLNDVLYLESNYGMRVARAIDVGVWADGNFMKYKHYVFKGLKDVVKGVLHKEMAKPKEITMSDWAVKELTYRQIEYACIDAYVSFKLALFLSKRKRGEEKREYTEDDFRLSDASGTDSD